MIYMIHHQGNENDEQKIFKFLILLYKPGSTLRRKKAVHHYQ